MIELLHEFHDALGRLLVVLDNPGPYNPENEKRMNAAEKRFWRDFNRLQKVMHEQRRVLASKGTA